MRTTLRIDTPILDEVKKLQEEEGGSLGSVVTRLLSEALTSRQERVKEPEPFTWISKPMNAKIDLEDRDAIYEILDEEFLDSKR